MRQPGGDDLDACVTMWLQMSRGEVLDIAEHHGTHGKDWFNEEAGTQPTWAKLIWLLLGYKGEEATAAATLRYQKACLGPSTGETALLELSSSPAKNNGVDVPRELFRAHRIATIREHALEVRPTFVVFYSPDPRYRAAWNEIAGVSLERDAPVKVGSTVFAITYHPNGEWSKAYWTSMGAKIRGAVTSGG